MANQRFPKERYVRQLREMRRDLSWWIASYDEAAANHQDDWLGARFAARSSVLQLAARQIFDALDTMEQLPRVS